METPTSPPDRPTDPAFGSEMALLHSGPDRGWHVRHSAGSAASFHHREPQPRHEIWIHQAERPALVLGSTQRIRRPVDESESGLPVDPEGSVEVCRRRSGGGLVYVDPGTDIWIDAIVPAGSGLHRDDVGQAFEWIGLVWLHTLAAALHEVEASDPSGPGGPSALIDRPSTANRLRLGQGSRSPGPSRRPFFCFAEVGRGEIVADGRKVVGISQRRTRQWTRLQSLFLPYWRPDTVNQVIGRTIGPVATSDQRLGTAPYDANAVPAGLPPSLELRPEADVIAAFIDNLPPVAG